MNRNRLHVRMRVHGTMYKMVSQLRSKCSSHLSELYLNMNSPIEVVSIGIPEKETRIRL